LLRCADHDALDLHWLGFAASHIGQGLGRCAPLLGPRMFLRIEFIEHMEASRIVCTSDVMFQF
jgi:hypothetical protein